MEPAKEQMPRPFRVGEPIHERALTQALIAQAGRMFRPGPGRSVYIIEEAVLTHGRPDLVLVAASPAALAAFRRAGLRLAHPTMARTLDPERGDDAFGVGRDYGLRLRRQAHADGWTAKLAVSSAAIVADSLGVEAKMSDWRRAIRQIAAFRRSVHSSSMLVPRGIASRVQTMNLDFYGAGLMTHDRESGLVDWVRRPDEGNPSVADRLWILELLVRGLEDGTVHRFSAATNMSSASARTDTFAR